MSVIVSDVEKRSYGAKCGIKAGDVLLTLNGNEIMDVLDYRFYQQSSKLKIEYINSAGKKKIKTVKKKEAEELGLLFDTYLMDKQRSCKNKCVFCFIDQLPQGLRESLYFKDDDSRLSFLFGNYITLTNITEHEVDRIIKMHISPVNVSVHTTNPELRVKMMKNRFAGESLKVLRRICEAGIKVNCQLVLVPGMNDGEELERSLNDLLKYPTVLSVACVPVGLSGHREGLEKLEPFNPQTAGNVIDVISKYQQMSLKTYKERRVFAADEFYLIAEREMPDYEFYEDFLQLENGVGMWSLLLKEATDALKASELDENCRTISCVTGYAAYPLITKIVDMAKNKWHNFNCKVFPIKNNFFGGEINVTGLVVGKDIIEQLKDKDLGEYLIVPSVMLRRERDMFLDNVTLKELQQELSLKVVVTDNDGFQLIDSFSEDI